MLNHRVKEKKRFFQFFNPSIFRAFGSYSVPICVNLWSEKPVRGLCLFCPQISTDYHRFLNIKDILIITVFLGTEIHGFFKDTAWLRIVSSTALRGYGLLAQVHGLVCFVRKPMRSPAVPFI